MRSAEQRGLLPGSAELQAAIRTAGQGRLESCCTGRARNHLGFLIEDGCSFREFSPGKPGGVQIVLFEYSNCPLHIFCLYLQLKVGAASALRFIPGPGKQGGDAGFLQNML